jgi:two-component system, chemotaxis family, chemotaxis protein CheY
MLQAQFSYRLENRTYAPDKEIVKTLVAEDDFCSRLLLQEYLKPYGAVHIAVNGKEAVEAVRAAMAADDPYNLICLDITMPEMDGHQALKEIRTLEESRGILPPKGSRILMISALDDMKNVFEGFRGLCDAYLCKAGREVHAAGTDSCLGARRSSFHRLNISKQPDL